MATPVLNHGLNDAAREVGRVIIDDVPVSIQERISLISQTIMFSEEMSLEFSRVQQLKKYRLLFLSISIFFMVLAIATPSWGLRSEPFWAIFFSFFGLFVVFVLKVADATGKWI